MPKATEMLDTALTLFKKHFQDILIITLIVYIPINIILEFVPVPEITSTEEFITSLRLNLRVMQLLEGLIGIIAAMAVIYVTAQSIKGKIIGWKEALQFSLSRWVPQFTTGIMQNVFLIGLFLLLIVPGIIFGVFWAFTFQIVTLRDKKWRAALAESKSIVQGRWWSIFGFFVLFFIIELIAGLVVSALIMFFPDQSVLNVATNLLFDIVSHYFVVLGTVFFLNAEQTKFVAATK